ncbi:MAG TPA: hypothetical protein VFB01_13205, partial [Burkholderiales bacterium]|nr:hypothetical protein [Burkholderiales bacterium]
MRFDLAIILGEPLPVLGRIGRLRACSLADARSKSDKHGNPDGCDTDDSSDRWTSHVSSLMVGCCVLRCFTIKTV